MEMFTYYIIHIFNGPWMWGLGIVENLIKHVKMLVYMIEVVNAAVLIFITYLDKLLWLMSYYPSPVFSAISLQSIDNDEIYLIKCLNIAILVWGQKWLKSLWNDKWIEWKKQPLIQKGYVYFVPAHVSFEIPS